MYNRSFVLRGTLCLCLLVAYLPDTVNAIVNGVNATIDMFPEIVQLSQRYYRSFVCAGFLVTDRHVVTAAHCVDGLQHESDGNYMKVIANTSYAMEGGMERDIEAFYVPDAFGNSIHYWDVAVIKLKEPLPLGKGIQVAKMGNKRWGKQEILRIAGWGATKFGGPPVAQLMAASVRTISDHKCKQRTDIFTNKEGEYIYKDSNFTDTISCTLSKGHVGVCKGDSGGPVYIGTEVYATVAAGMGCGLGKRPSFYTSIAKTRKFINAALCYEASQVEVENLQVFIPDLLCRAVPDVNGIFFTINIPGAMKFVEERVTWMKK